MATEKTVEGFEIDEDLSFQRRSWRIQRIGWAVMALVILGALLGLLGPGPLSSTTSGNPDGPLEVEYDRFLRFETDTHLQIHLQPNAQSSDTVHLWLDRHFLEDVQIIEVTPPPDQVEPGPDRLVYHYQKTEPNTPTAVTIYFEPHAVGRLEGRIGVGEEPGVTFNQFVYP